MISICIPIFADAEYLPFTIESCLLQDDDIEIVVLDDASSDATTELRERYGVDARVKWTRSEDVLAPHESWNAAVQASTRPYVKLLRAGDTLKPGAVRELLEFIELRPQVACHGHLADFIDARGRLIHRQRRYGEGFDGFELTGVEALRWKLHRQVPLHEPSATLFRKAAWQRVGGYRAAGTSMMNLLFDVRLSSQFPSACWNRHLVRIRRHTPDGAPSSLEASWKEGQTLAQEILSNLDGMATREDQLEARTWAESRLLEILRGRFRHKPLRTLLELARNRNVFGACAEACRHHAGRLWNRVSGGAAPAPDHLPLERRIQRPFTLDLTRSKTPWDRKTLFLRLFWAILVKPVFMLLPRRASALRIWLLRRMGAGIGRRCLIEPRVRILMPWNLELGDDVAIGREVEFLNFAPVRIDSMTVISQYSYLCTGTHDYTHPHFPLQYAPIFIGPECWVAAGVFVGPGVTIGRGAVIGARSVVTRSMPEWMVCAGHPCRPLKPRTVRDLNATRLSPDTPDRPPQTSDPGSAPTDGTASAEAWMANDLSGESVPKSKRAAGMVQSNAS